LQIYYIFGFLFLVMIVLVVTCAEVSILLCYFQVRPHYSTHVHVTGNLSHLPLTLMSFIPLSYRCCSW
jgi:transmembrane 9 superfamily protein 2/4